MNRTKSVRRMRKWRFKLERQVFPSSQSGCMVHNIVRLNSDHAITIDEELKTQKLLHDFGIDDPKEVERLSYIEGNGVNKQYIRFLVPKDSVLDSGLDLKTETGTGNYTIFSTFHRTEPMKSSILEFGYTTTVPNCQPEMNSYLQPGMRGMEVVRK